METDARTIVRQGETVKVKGIGPAREPDTTICRITEGPAKGLIVFVKGEVQEDIIKAEITEVRQKCAFGIV